MLGILTFLLFLLFFDPVPEEPKVGRMAAVVALMAILWITEAVPLAATSLIPIVAFPVLEILDSASIAKAYVNSIIFLFIGGFLIALSMEKWNLHRRIALNIINLIGQRADTLVLGFMAASAFLSMWISNTATAVMMLPIGLAIATKMEEQFGKERTHPMVLALMLGIAYGCSIGGVATLVGTPTNLAFVRIFTEIYPEAPLVSFGQWLILGVPYALVLLAITWFLLTHVFCRMEDGLALDRSIIKKELISLGPMRFEEKAVLVVFASTAILWTFRRDLHLGDFTLPGWSGIWGPLKNLDDGTVAVTMALILFFIPAKNQIKSKRILEGDVFGKLPWSIILLFGGGFALASGFGVSGLSRYIGESFTALGDIPILLIIALICLCVTFLTELTSNVATASMLLPLLAVWATSRELHPLVFMVPATISASMAFMMPVATPPNAVVFGSQRIRIAEMARVGIFLNLVAVFLTIVMVRLLLPVIFGAEISTFPDWAR